jgi:transcriptional regulator with XRE-family HTH domain
MGLAEKLKFYRERKKLYQQDVASFLNVTQQTISHYEKGRIVPDLETLIKLTQLYEVELNELYLTDSYIGLMENPKNSFDASNKEQFLCSERLKRRRIERHLSQEDLAKLMDQPISVIIDWETTNVPTGKVTYKFANRLAIVLQSPLPWLMGMSDSTCFVPPLPEAAYFEHSIEKQTEDYSNDEAELLSIWTNNISELTSEQRKKRLELSKLAFEMVKEVERLYCQNDKDKSSK